MSQPVIPPVVRPGVTLGYHQAQVPQGPRGWTSVRMYALLPEKVQSAVRAQVAVRVALQLFFTIILTIFLCWMFSGYLQAIWSALLIFIAIQATTLVIGCLRMAHRTRVEWPHFRLFVGDQGLMRVLPGYPDLIILNQEIKHIYETSSGIAVRSKRGYLGIWSGIEHYNEIRRHLEQFGPIISPARTWLITLRNIALMLIVTAVSVAAFFWGMASRDWRVELPTFIFTLGLTGWSVYRGFRNPNKNLEHKLIGLLALIVPLILGLKILATHLLLP